MIHSLSTPIPAVADSTKDGMTELDPASVVDAYHRAWTSAQIDQALSYVSDDIRCSAPGDRAVTTEGWRAYLTGFQPRLTAAPEHARMSSGEQVALWCYPQTAVTSRTLANELFTVRDGQIVDIHLSFDRLS